MLKKARRRIKRPRKPTLTRKVLEAFDEGLEELASQFEWVGFSDTEEVPSQGLAEPVNLPREAVSGNEDVAVEREGTQLEGEEEVNDDFDEEPLEASVYQREDVEVGIDLFISHLTKEGIITEPESLDDIFGEFFGESHEITQAAREFEEHTKGYFDAIVYEDMHTAFLNLIRIRKIIKEELARHGNR